MFKSLSLLQYISEILVIRFSLQASWGEPERPQPKDVMTEAGDTSNNLLPAVVGNAPPDKVSIDLELTFICTIILL